MNTTNPTPRFTHAGVAYVLHPLTLGQMELASGLLHEHRRRIFEDLSTNSDGGTDLNKLNKLLKITITLADVVFELNRSRKLAAFCAVCVTPEGGVFDESQLEQTEAAFKHLPYDKAEEIIGFFFASGSFAKLLIPSYLQTPVQPAAAEASAT